MKKNSLILVGVALLMVIAFILVRDQMEKPSDERFDQEEGISVIDVWVRHDIDQERNVVVRDELLWHIDPDQVRYKFSDAFAFNEEGYLLEA